MSKGQIGTDYGQISVSPEVIAFYAGSQAVECFGIVGMAAVRMRDGIVRILRRDSLSKGIHVKIEDNALVIELHVIIAYGVSIKAVTDNLIETIKYKVEAFTGMELKKVKVFVEGVRVID